MLPIPSRIFTTDVEASIAFYEKLGFELTTAHPASPPFDSALMKGGLVSLVFEGVQADNSQAQPTQIINLKVQGLDAFFEFISGSVAVKQSPHLDSWGTRSFTILDNNGYELCFEEA